MLVKICQVTRGRCQQRVSTRRPFIKWIFLLEHTTFLSARSTIGAISDGDYSTACHLLPCMTICFIAIRGSPRLGEQFGHLFFFVNESLYNLSSALFLSHASRKLIYINISACFPEIKIFSPIGKTLN